MQATPVVIPRTKLCANFGILTERSDRPSSSQSLADFFCRAIILTRPSTSSCLTNLKTPDELVTVLYVIMEGLKTLRCRSSLRSPKKSEGERLVYFSVFGANRIAEHIVESYLRSSNNNDTALAFDSIRMQGKRASGAWR